MRSEGRGQIEVKTHRANDIGDRGVYLCNLTSYL